MSFDSQSGRSSIEPRAYVVRAVNIEEHAEECETFVECQHRNALQHPTASYSTLVLAGIGIKQWIDRHPKNIRINHLLYLE